MRSGNIQPVLDLDEHSDDNGIPAKRVKVYNWNAETLTWERGSSASVSPDTATLSNVTMTGSSVTLAASNTDRKGLYIFNDSGVTVYVKLGTTASSTSFTVKMSDQDYYELPSPIYTGIVTVLGASGSVRVTEVT